MKKKRNTALILLAVLCCAAFGAYRFVSERRADHVPPLISVPEAPLSVSVHDADEVLLQGITAQDDRDGDVTASLVIERVGDLCDTHSAAVWIAAFDAAGNVAKASRTVEFTDYESPHFTLSAPLLFRESYNIDVFSVIGAQDVYDGTLTDRIKGMIVSDDSSIDEAGEYTVEFRVTNSLGDTSYLTAPVEVYSGNPYNADIVLDSYLLYLKTGEEFNAQAHLVSMEAGITQVDFAHMPEDCDVRIDGTVDTQTPGVYPITYTVTINQYKGCTRLLAVVEE